jgi:hypothetical protein
LDSEKSEISSGNAIRINAADLAVPISGASIPDLGQLTRFYIGWSGAIEEKAQLKIVAQRMLRLLLCPGN